MFRTFDTIDGECEILGKDILKQISGHSDALYAGYKKEIKEKAQRKFNGGDETLKTSKNEITTSVTFVGNILNDGTKKQVEKYRNEIGETAKGGTKFAKTKTKSQDCANNKCTCVFTTLVEEGKATEMAKLIASKDNKR